MEKVQRLDGSGSKGLRYSPRRLERAGHYVLISDAHEWINEIPTVPIYYLAKPQPRERAWQNQRGKKTLDSKGSKVKASRETARCE
ncbi:hypothetical protein CANCADRAFT_55305 [Tortispora caseinolytica NRRL Y-17796]|uniref:Uncharacterized protein n=1 Tax=Tortispora caseinolytica NRRL Y-17796 TaxID=767744 RepID=A0A1E4T9B7_9ASCO|nr:hypothetical protein CANCADRAFT_55305 [Tortispora caseinolytica NRRL Y-17796]